MKRGRSSVEKESELTKMVAENKKLQKRLHYLQGFKDDANRYLDILSNLNWEYKWKCDECGSAWKKYDRYIHYDCGLCGKDFCESHVSDSDYQLCSECDRYLCCHKCKESGKSGDFSICKCGKCKINYNEEDIATTVNNPLYHICASCSGHDL